MKPIKQKLTFQEYTGNRYWKAIRTYLKNRGKKRTKRQCIRLA